MSTRLLPQAHCSDVTDHPAHKWDDGWQGWLDGHRTRVYRGRASADAALRRYDIDSATPVEKLCPGRHTPSNYRAPRPSPSVPSDPFFGIDDNEE